MKRYVSSWKNKKKREIFPLFYGSPGKEAALFFCAALFRFGRPVIQDDLSGVKLSELDAERRCEGRLGFPGFGFQFRPQDDFRNGQCAWTHKPLFLQAFKKIEQAENLFG